MIRPFRGKHPQIHPTAFIEESAQVVGDVVIGEQSSVWFGAVVRGGWLAQQRPNQIDEPDYAADGRERGEQRAAVEREPQLFRSLLVAGRERVLREIRRRSLGRHVS